MNAPERRRKQAKRIAPQKSRMVMRTGSLRAFRRVAAEIRDHLPEPRKDESIARELAELRLRGGRA